MSQTTTLVGCGGLVLSIGLWLGLAEATPPSEDATPKVKPVAETIAPPDGESTPAAPTPEAVP